MEAELETDVNTDIPSEPPVPGAILVHEYEKSDGTHVRDHWRGPNGEHIDVASIEASSPADAQDTPSLSKKDDSSAIYVLGRNGEPQLASSPDPKARNTATYGSEEQAYHAAYVRRSHSLNEALRYEKKYAAWADNDPAIQSIIDKSFSGKKFAEFQERDGATSLIPVKRIRQARKTRKMTEVVRRSVADAQRAQRRLPEPQRMAAKYASVAALESDIALLKKSVADNSLSSVVYTNAHNDGTFRIQSRTNIRKDDLARDLEASGISTEEINSLYDVQDTGYSVSGVKEAFNGTLDIVPGSKGAPAKRTAAWDAAGLSTTVATYSPDSSCFKAIAKSVSGTENSAAVMSGRINDESLGSMSPSAQRAMLCELGVAHQKMKDEITAYEDGLRRRGANEGDPGKFFAVGAGDADGIRYKRKNNTVLDEAKVDEFVKKHKLNRSSLRKTSSTLKVDDFKKFAAKHHMSAYKYLNPSHAVSIRDSFDPRAYDGHTTAARSTAHA